jgi:cytochrome c553
MPQRRPSAALLTSAICTTSCAAVICLGLASLADDKPGSPVSKLASLAVSPAEAEFFEKSVRPLLLAKCVDCHGADKQKGGLRLDSRDAALRGGDSGAAIEPGKPDDSRLIEAISYRTDLKMPPKSKLSDAEIAHLTDWVKRGAPWPSSKPVSPPKPDAAGPLFTAEEKSFWAFQPVRDPAVPQVKQSAWPKSPLDRFILAALEARGLSPAAPADKLTLMRRATFDLIGLPPTPDEVEKFLADESPDAFAKVVDRLLASPHYGERWGRHWLDVARYGDSNGLDENLAFANAYRYRDYVVAAFNSDKPFDQFVREQIAGDLLPDDLNSPPGRGVGGEGLRDTSPLPSGGEGSGVRGPTAPTDALTATGFLCIGPKMLAEDDPVKMQMDIIDEQVDTIGRAFMGLTLGCARCHDHKFDPIPTADYYSLAGIFKGTKTMDNFSVVARWQERPLGTPEAIRLRDEHQQRVAGQKAAIAKFIEQTNDTLLREARQHVGDYLLAAENHRRLDAWLTEAKKSPLGADAKSAAQPGVVVIEAENYTRGNLVKDSTTYGNGIGVIYNKGEFPNFAEYDITLPEAGLHRIELRYAAAGARPCKLIVNGRLVKSDAAGQVTGSWNPDTQTWFVESVVPLKSGPNTIRLERTTEPIPHFDKLLIAPARQADGQPLTVLAATGRDADGPIAYEPIPALVRQWAEYLKRVSPLAPLGRGVGGEGRSARSLDGPTPQPSPQTGEGAVNHSILADWFAKPDDIATLRDLAARYQQQFAAADKAWRELKATDAGRDATALGDPVLEAYRVIVFDPQGPFTVPKDFESSYPAAAATDLAARRDELKSLEKSMPMLPETMAVSDQKPENLKIHIRGSHLTLGPEVPRQFPRIIAGENQTPIDDSQSGRLQLADWLASPAHPLTSRVMANRIWLGHFGEGIVRSPDNFGRLGERPTHPELLDWLARRFVESGWSIKAMHRLIMLSSTYQMASTWNEAAAAADPENRLHWHHARRRLEIESLRDSLLAISGKLDRTLGGSLLRTANRAYVTSTASVDPVIYQTHRRSIYLPIVRSALLDVFQVFDFADPNVQTGRRDTTTVAPQSLFLMNSPFVSEQTKALAERLLNDGSLDDVRHIRTAYELIFTRPPTDSEVTRSLAYLDRYAQAETTRSVTPAAARLRAWQSLCRALLASNEFVFVE